MTTKPYPIITEFNIEGEFLEELRADGGHVDTGIVRVTKSFRRHTLYPLHDVSIIATYIRDGRLVRLSRYVGQVWPHDWKNEQEMNVKVEAIADGIISAIVEVCNTLNLSTRPGIYQQEASPCS